MKVKGIVSWTTRDAKTGEVIPEESGSRSKLVTNVGLIELARVLAKTAFDLGYEIAVGTNDTVEDADDTQLHDEIFSSLATSVSADGGTFTAKLFMDTTEGNGNTLREACLKHNGIMIDRSLLTPVIVKDSSKTVTIQVDLALARDEA